MRYAPGKAGRPWSRARLRWGTCPLPHYCNGTQPCDACQFLYSSKATVDTAISLQHVFLCLRYTHTYPSVLVPVNTPFIRLPTQPPNTYTYLWMYSVHPIQLPTHMHTHLLTYIPQKHTYLPTYIYTYIQTYLHLYIHTYIHTCTHTYNIPMHTHTYMYAHVYTPPLVCVHAYLP